MEEESFPLKYLGVNLRPTKWKASNCGIILDKFNAKLNGWASRNFYFADFTSMTTLNQAVKGGKFKVNKFYNTLIGAVRALYSAIVWHKLLVPKHKFIYWQIINDQLLTRDHLSRFFSIPSNLCAVCENAQESHNHLFMEFTFTKKLIESIESWVGNLNWPSNI
ncbi:hypothetical protein G4B88_005015 [Cannabis sativa]|uniref:Reverse transcriptase zinc-binding domain-containing protein n=1 Tax=Cannabis sativa TaxID=3483 RepID=A0A7J6H4F3_CANSA|nr:hypothetical protein G4B88_005015 [Cannabis sativa]